MTAEGSGICLDVEMQRNNQAVQANSEAYGAEKVIRWCSHVRMSDARLPKVMLFGQVKGPGF